MEEVTITIAEFYAFNMKLKKPYVNESEESILIDLDKICNSNRLISLKTYKATLVDEKNFDAVDSDGTGNPPKKIG